MVWMANQMARFSTTPTTAAVIADKAALSALLPRRVSMNGAAEEDPKEARREGDPRGKQPAEGSREHWRKSAWIPKRRHEAHELEHHDQWSRRRLRHAQTIEHFAGLQPTVVLDGLLRDVGKH